MNITIDVSSIELSSDDKKLIQESLGLQPTDIDHALERLCKTAFMEYVKMFKEKGLPTRADEVIQERLYFLLNHFFINRLPNENEISSIFQLTTSQSKTLLRNTKSRYRTKISSYLRNTLLQTLTSMPVTTGDREFVCLSPTIVEELNSIVSQKGPELKPIEKIKGLASKYRCSEDTFKLLERELN